MGLADHFGARTCQNCKTSLDTSKPDGYLSTPLARWVILQGSCQQEATSTAALAGKSPYLVCGSTTSTRQSTDPLVSYEYPVRTTLLESQYSHRLLSPSRKVSRQQHEIGYPVDSLSQSK